MEEEFMVEHYARLVASLEAKLAALQTHLIRVVHAGDNLRLRLSLCADTDNWNLDVDALEVWDDVIRDGRNE